MSTEAESLRMAEALLFAAAEPLEEGALASRLPEGADVAALLAELAQAYAGRGVNLVQVAGKWQFRTAPDLAFLMRIEKQEIRRLSRAAIETLAIIAYHQPVTRAEIEEIRGVGLSKGTLDLLLEIEWVRISGRRQTPGRPVTYGTSEAFLVHFGLAKIGDLPGLEELKATGLLDPAPPGMETPASEETEAEPLPPEEPFDERETETEGDGEEPTQAR
jgi:segregation and condensation protein B